MGLPNCHLRPGRLRSNQVNNIIRSITLGPSEVEQLSNAGDYRSALRRADHSDSPASCKVQQPFVTKDVKCANHSVLVDAKFRCQVDCGGESLALFGFAFSNRSANFRCHLFVERKSRILVENCAIHRTTIHSTIESATGKEFQ